jgi:REP element-mobilizing transposase RayT
MSVVKVYVHLVWGTKNRYPFLSTNDIRNKMWSHIKENSIEKGIFIDHVNGYKDHCHCLVSLNADQNIEDVVQLLKGESSFWANRNLALGERFGWAAKYYAVSVSPRNLDTVRKYIRNQEEHHKVTSFQGEYLQFMREYGFDFEL